MTSSPKLRRSHSPGPHPRSAASSLRLFSPTVRRRWKAASLVAALILFPLIISSCNSDEEDAPDTEEIVDAPPPETGASPVETVTIEPMTFRDRVELIGELAPRRDATVVSEIPARILSISADEGDRVSQRDTLVRLDVSQHEASRRQLEVQLAQLDRDIDRAGRLRERGLTSESDTEQLEAQRDSLREQRSQLDITLGHSRVRAPLSGVIVERMSEPGEYAQPGMPILRMVDLSEMKVRVGIPERDVRYISEGAEVEVHVGALDETRAGTIHRVGVEVDSRNRSFPVEILIDNEDGLLRSGMRSQVIITRRDLTDVLVIPRDSVVQGFDDRYVMVVGDGDRVDQRPVELGPSLGPWVVATSGLTPGDQLVVRGQRSLVQGSRVRPTDRGSCCGEYFEIYANEGIDRTEAVENEALHPATPEGEEVP